MKKDQAGVTLIELLIAVSLLSLLTVGVLVAMRIGFSTMEKTDDRLVRNRRVANARKIIENEIQGFELTIAYFHPKPETALPVPFVEWRPDGLRFVSTYSLNDAWRGRPQLIEMQVIPGENGVGVRLIVNETPYAGPSQTGLRVMALEPRLQFAPTLPAPTSFVLADKLSHCRFWYLEQIPKEPFRVWRQDWEQPNQLPLGIRIDMPPDPLTVMLNARPEPNGYVDAL